MEEDSAQDDVQRIERHAPMIGLESSGGGGSSAGRTEPEGEPPRDVDAARSSGVEESKDSGPGTNHHQQELPGRAVRRRELEVGPPASWMGEEGIGHGFKASLAAMLTRMEAEGLDLGESYVALHLEDLGDQLAEVADAGEEGERWALAVVWPSVRAVDRMGLADLQFDVQGVLANLRGERGLPACHRKMWSLVFTWTDQCSVPSSPGRCFAAGGDAWPTCPFEKSKRLVLCLRAIGTAVRAINAERQRAAER